MRNQHWTCVIQDNILKAIASNFTATWVLTSWFNILRPEWNGPYFADRVFNAFFFSKNVRIWNNISLWYPYNDPRGIKTTLVRVITCNRQEAITWTNEDPVVPHIYMCMPQQKLCFTAMCQSSFLFCFVLFLFLFTLSPIAQSVYRRAFSLQASGCFRHLGSNPALTKEIQLVSFQLEVTSFSHCIINIKQQICISTHVPLSRDILVRAIARLKLTNRVLSWYHSILAIIMTSHERKIC